MDTKRLQMLLQNPPTEFRPQPVWSLNSLLTRSRLTEMLRSFKAQGMGGVFMLPRWGLITGFLTDEWFAVWGHALRECKRLGMECQIYDEFVCPSGSGGGHTTAEAPHTAARFLEATTYTSPPRGGGAVAAFALDRDLQNPRPVELEALKAASSERPFLALGWADVPRSAGAGGFPLPDLTRHDATATFLAVGYEPYARRFRREFGKAILYVFSDESHLPRSNRGFLWSELLGREFHKDHGYRLEDQLAPFCFGGDHATAVRFDYLATVNRLYCRNFAKQIHDWCVKHNLAFTGHFYEEHWADPSYHPSVMALLRWMHAPGNDYLAFQVFPDDLAANRLHRFNLREMASVANQLGRAKTMVESSGAGGYGVSFALFKQAEDMLLAHGVNVMNPHLSHVSLAGARQYEWPQTISDHSSWYPWYRLHADHVARTAAVLSQGKEVNRVLLLQPTTSLWMRYAPPVLHRGEGPASPELQRIADGHLDVFLALADRQLDFDLGDETILEELGKARAGKLAVGHRAYDVVAMPHVMENLTAATLRLLRQYLTNGGRIVQVGNAAPTHVDGRPNAQPAQLKAQYVGQWESVPTARALADRVAMLVPPRLTTSEAGPLPQGLIWRRAELPGGDAVWFFCNPWNKPLTMAVRIAGRQLVDLDTATGAMRALPAERLNGELVMPLTLHPRGHALWLSRAKASADVPPVAAPWEGQAVKLGEPEVTALSHNQLLLDYCDLDSGDAHLAGTTTIRADDANWRVQGFPGSPWRLGISQFNRNFIDHEVAPDSAFRVAYRFDVDAAYPSARRAALSLAVERPWLYTIKINGRAVSFAKARRWFDEHMRELPVGRRLRAGENTVELCAPRFHMLCEIKPVYILGDFALQPAAKGFRIVAPRPLSLGDWTVQGLPFYPHGVRYTWRIALPRSVGKLRLELGSWAGAAANVLLDGRSVGAILHPPYAVEISGPIRKGRHELAVEVIGNMRNMLGPHFSDGLAGPWSWQWGPPASAPPGDAYARQASGLLAPPTLRI
ncbi:MAG: glycosyl hydrolase [Planctomycetota bacterium]|nr:glycosyl hydrolase [Planctomycetota bacterium]